MKKLLALCLSVAMLLGLLTVSPAVQATEETDLTFTAGETYTASTPLAALPKTIEARIYFDSAFSGRGGIIFGNYRDNNTQYVSFEVRDGGFLQLGMATSTGAVNYAFTGTYVYTGNWMDVAVTWDKEGNRAGCYIDGELVQTVTGSAVPGGLDLSVQPNHRIGGDHRDGNAQYFKGQISDVTVYSDVRTPEEIAADITAPDYTDSNMVCAYDLTETTDLKLIDLSAKKNHLTYTGNSLTRGGVAFGYDPDAAIKEGKRYVMDETPGAPIKTVEALIYLSASLPNGFGGSIVSNYNEGGTDIFRLNVDSNNPTLYFKKYGETTEYTVRFDQVAVCISQWVHLAVTIDADSHTFNCYVDGKLAQTVVDETVPAVNLDMPLCVGGDYWSANDHIFRENIASVTLYSDIRTADEILADTIKPLAANVNSEDGALLACYDLNEVVDLANIPDLSGYDNTLRRPLYAKTADTGYDYTFAVVGDTQNLVRYHVDYVDDLYQWIADNASAEKQNIQFVFGLGDMTDQNIDSEWTTVKNNIDILKNAGIPFSMVRGNHDGNVLMNQYFPYSEYGNTTGSAVSGCYDGSYNGNTYQMENYYQELTIGEIRYLMLSLEYGAPDGVLAWANEVIAAHPDHQVIVTTHNFLDETGNLNDEIPQNTNAEGFYPGYYGEGANSPQDMWDECLSRHKNVVLVMSGHVFWNNIRSNVLTGQYGNRVQALMINPQLVDLHYTTGAGMVALLHFSNGGKNVSVEYYSTVKGQYYNPINQMSVVIGDAAAAAIGDKEYADFDTALAAANSEETVVLLSDVKVDESVLIVPQDVTVDLCGKRLQVDNLLAFGNMIDSKQGVGGIVITNDRTKAFVQLQETNPALPLYDTANGCYRFVDYSFEYKIKETTDTYIKYAIHLALPTEEAYALLKDGANSELISIRLLVNRDEATKQKIDYAFMDSTIAAYADLSAKDLNAKKALVLTVKGLDALNEATVEATARILSATGVARQGVCSLA